MRCRPIVFDDCRSGIADIEHHISDDFIVAAGRKGCVLIEQQPDRATRMRHCAIRHLVERHLFVAVVDGDDEPLEDLETEYSRSRRKARPLIVGQREHLGGLVGDVSLADPKVRDGGVAGLVDLASGPGRREGSFRRQSERQRRRLRQDEMAAVVELESERPFAVEVDGQEYAPPVIVFIGDGRAGSAQDLAVVGQRRRGE